MKILYIATANVFVRSGGGIANLAYYKVFEKLYPNSVDFLISEDVVVDNNLVKNVRLVPNRSKFEKIKSLFTGEIHRYKKYVRKILSKEKYDICFINGGHYAGDMIDLLHEHGVKVIVMNHNFEIEYQSTVKSNFFFKKFFIRHVVKNEHYSYKKAEANCFITKEDLALFRRAYGETSSIQKVIGVYDPSKERIPDYHNRNNKFTIVISGSVNADQTVDGIRDFHDIYWDVLKNIIPDCKIIITGRNADRLYTLFPDFSNSNIEVIPNPEDIYEVVSKAHLYLCPTNVGGGLKLRVMDGLKLGLPVLVHKVSSRGYDNFINKPYFKVYQDKESFAQGLESLVYYVKNQSGDFDIRKEYDAEFGIDRGVSLMSDLLKEL